MEPFKFDLNQAIAELKKNSNLAGQLSNPLSESPKFHHNHHRSYSSDILLIREFQPATPSQTTVLLVTDPLRSPHITDISPDISLINALLGQGIGVNLVHWQFAYLARPDCNFDRLREGLALALSEIADEASNNAIGIWHGGWCLPETTQNTIFIDTPINPSMNHGGWAEVFSQLEQLFNNQKVKTVPSVVVKSLLAAFQPFNQVKQKTKHFGHGVSEPDDVFLNVEKWLNESPDLGAGLLSDVIEAYRKQTSITMPNDSNILCVQCDHDQMIPFEHTTPKNLPVQRARYKCGHLGLFTNKKRLTLLSKRIHKLLI